MVVWCAWLQARYMAGQTEAAPTPASAAAAWAALDSQGSSGSVLSLTSQSGEFQATVQTPADTTQAATSTESAPSSSRSSPGPSPVGSVPAAKPQRMSRDDKECVLARPSLAQLAQATQLLVKGALALPEQHAATTLFCARVSQAWVHHHDDSCALALASMPMHFFVHKHTGSRA